MHSGYYFTSKVRGKSVQAFVPNPLPPPITAQSVDYLAARAQPAETALARLEQAGQNLASPDDIGYPFLLKEALASSALQGNKATLTDVLIYEQTKHTGSSSIDDIEEVKLYDHTVGYALGQLHTARGLSVSMRLLHKCHARLMQGKQGADEQAGEIRRSQNWIGGTPPGRHTVYVTPPPDRVAELLSRLEQYIRHDSDLPPLLRIALIHAQFELIHPYMDANGRVGRMLITLLLDRSERLTHPLLYLSSYLKENQDEYYRSLDYIRTGPAWNDWIYFFLDAVESVATEAANKVSQLGLQVSQDRKALLAVNRVTVTVPAVQLFELLPEYPVVSMPVVRRLLRTTKPTAGNAIKLLQRTGILFEIGERKRNRIYSYRPYLDLLG